MAQRFAAALTMAITPALAWALAALTWDAAAGLAREVMRAPSLALVNTTLADALTVFAGATGSAVAAYLSLTSVFLLATPRQSRLRRAAARVTPRPWRRIVAIAATGAVSAGLALPAAAAPSTSDAGWLSEPVSGPTLAAPDPGPAAGPTPAAGVAGGADVGRSAAAFGVEPSQPTPAPMSAAATDTALEGDGPPHDPSADTYVVEVGDSLWSITADALFDAEPSGTDRPAAPDVASAWPQLYDENRAAIGEDPALIHPGTELMIPEGWAR